jgi:hypothetical protein
MLPRRQMLAMIEERGKLDGQGEPVSECFAVLLFVHVSDYLRTFVYKVQNEFGWLK